MEPSRQERRSRARERSRRGARLTHEGLDLADEPASAALLARHLIGILGRRRDDRRASKAASAVHRVFERTIARSDALPALDCRKGCAYCCSLFVSAAIPEVLLLAGAIGRGAAGEAASLAASLAESRRAAGHLAIGDMARKPIPCGLLRDNLCTYYAERPLGCRGHVSQSLEACVANYDDPTAPIPGSVPHGRAARASKLALFAALKAVGLPHRSYELNAALERALETGDAERRWLQGEDVFAGLPTDPTRTPEVEEILDRLIRGAAR